MTELFISYSHDSDAHRGRVWELAKKLKADGVPVVVDLETNDPETGWPRWSAGHAEHADKVIVIITETYRQRFYGEIDEVNSRGRGAAHEAIVISQRLYNTKHNPL